MNAMWWTLKYDLKTVMKIVLLRIFIHYHCWIIIYDLVVLTKLKRQCYAKIPQQNIWFCKRWINIILTHRLRFPWGCSEERFHLLCCWWLLNQSIRVYVSNAAIIVSDKAEDNPDTNRLIFYLRSGVGTYLLFAFLQDISFISHSILCPPHFYIIS